jgi:cell division protein FtsZ
MQMAISSPLLEDVTIDGAMGILVNITGPREMALTEIDEAMQLVHGACHPDANIIFGTLVDESLQDEVKITVIATGFQAVSDRADRPATKIPGLAVQAPAAPPHLANLPGRQRVATPVPAYETEQVRNALNRVEKSNPRAVLRDLKRDSMPELPGLEEQYDIPAFLRRNQGKGE